MINKKDIEVTGSDLSEATTEIEKFAKKVFDKLIEENVYPIPYYYSIYFFNMLEDEPAEFKKSVMELIELEGQNEFEEDLKFEQKLKKSFIVHMCKFGVLYHSFGKVSVIGIVPLKSKCILTFQYPKLGIVTIALFATLKRSSITFSGL